jgi:hypothetical protein
MTDQLIVPIIPPATRLARGLHGRPDRRTSRGDDLTDAR